MSSFTVVERTLRADRIPLLGGAPDAVALIDGNRSWTYADLTAEVDRVGRTLGSERRFVAVEMAHDLTSVATYLACLAGRHPVLVLPPGGLTGQHELVDRYRPDVVRHAGAPLEQRVAGSAHVLHPDLAVLLSTSGSTGSPKLVRLSLDNVIANAEAIAEYLHLEPADRAITALPLHYCYGLSVLTSHLVAGAGVVLTDLSVADACFWDLARGARVTGIAGVPHSFDLLDACGFEERDLPDVRYLTQAGGRMAPETVVRYADLGRRRGWDLYVMYGQTEATARIAYLPPDRARLRPNAVGVPIPGGSLRLEPVPGHAPDVGELVYSGPNVMLGYAEVPADLARGRELTELRTGDLARCGRDGLWEIVGRLNRNAKLFGLRIDLDRVERTLREEWSSARVVADDSVLHVVLPDLRRAGRVRRRAAELAGVPLSAVRTHVVAVLPTTGNGKIDYARLAQHVAELRSALPPAPAAVPRVVEPRDVRDLYAALLGRPDATVHDSFSDLGGDSLSFVEISVRLGGLLGTLPADWHRRDAVALAASSRERSRRTVPLEMSVLLRACAIVMVLVTHADIVLVPGGAHVLLAVAGYNLARFALAPGARRGKRAVRTRVAAAALAVAVPSALWIGGVALVRGEYRPATALFLNGLTGADRWDANWQFWFLEALVWGFLGLAALLCVPVLARVVARHPFGSAVSALAATLVLRYAWVGVEAGPTERYSTGLVLWCLALGWAVAEARSRRQRLLVGALAVVAVHGFFGDLQREAVIVAGVLALLVVRSVPVPRLLAPPVAAIAAASLWIYLTQWQVYPEIEDAGHPWLAVGCSLVVGLLAHASYRAVEDRARAAGRFAAQVVRRG